MTEPQEIEITDSMLMAGRLEVEDWFGLNENYGFMVELPPEDSITNLVALIFSSMTSCSPVSLINSKISARSWSKDSASFLRSPRVEATKFHC